MLKLEDEDGQTALHFAAKRGHNEAAQRLLEGLSCEERKTYVTTKDKKGRGALHFAAGYGSEAMVNTMLETGTDPQARDSDGKTALHFAALGQNTCGQYLEVGVLLVEEGADVRLLDSEDKSAYHYAQGSLKDGLTLVGDAVHEPLPAIRHGKIALVIKRKA